MAVPDLKQRGVSRLERHYMTMINHMSFAVARLAPKRVPVTYVTGFPKSGTVWVTQLIADYLQLPFVDLSSSVDAAP